MLRHHHQQKMPKKQRGEHGKSKASKQAANTLLLPKIGRGAQDPTDSMASDDDSNMDNASVYSFASSKCETPVMDEGKEEEGCDDGYYDDFEDKLMDAMSSATEKSVRARILALEAMTKAFKTRFMYDFIEERKVTILDILEKAIKKGKGEEQGVAANLSSIVAVTLGLSDDTEFIFKDMTSTLLTALTDTTISPSIRAKCATALGVNLFIHGDSRASEGGDIVKSTMEALAGNFCGSCLKGNGAVPTNLSPATTNMHTAALTSWALLLTLQSSSAIYHFAETLGLKVSEILESPDVELRIVAGETLALLYEICRESDADFELDNHDYLLERLKQLATDSQKSRGKKDRRIQRSSFRDILRGVEEGYSPSDVVKFSSQRLILNSWCRKRQYDSICAVLSSGMNLHLTENDLLRDIFGLGAAVSETNGAGRISKFERRMENIAAQKARTKNLSKLRDKRADVII